MTLAFHHFFVFVERGAPAVDRLVREGFVEGSRNSHPGQGTANRRLFFENGMLEFIWVENVEEIRSPLASPTKLWERSQFRMSGFSPFGVGLCPSAAGDASAGPPFSGWSYSPPYLPQGLSIWEASNEACPWEPMIFYLPFAKPFEAGVRKNEPIQHPNGATRIEKITITMKLPRGRLSDAAKGLQSTGLVELVAGELPKAEIRIAGIGAGIVDVREWCPLVITSVNRAG